MNLGWSVTGLSLEFMYILLSDSCIHICDVELWPTTVMNGFVLDSQNVMLFSCKLREPASRRYPDVRITFENTAI